MPDVTEQLRGWARSLADSVEPADLDRIKSPVAEPTAPFGSHRRLAVAASVVLIAAAIVAVATLSRGDSGDNAPATNTTQVDDADPTATTVPDTSPTTDPGAEVVPPTTTITTTSPTTTGAPEDRLAAWPPAPAEPSPVADVPRWLPTEQLAVGGTPVRGEAEGGNAATAVFTQVFANADGDVLLTLQTQPGGVDTTPEDVRRSITIDGWDDAFLTEGSLRLVASDPGGFVRLMGVGVDDDLAAELVATMRPRPAGVPGWDLSSQFTDLVEVNGAWNDSSGQRFVTWFDGDRVVAQMITSPTHTDLISQALSPSFERVDVNGAPGWFNSGDSRRAVVWSPDGENIVVLGVADDRVDPLSVARSVTELAADEYEARTTDQIPPGLGDGCAGSLFC